MLNKMTLISKIMLEKQINEIAALTGCSCLKAQELLVTVAQWSEERYVSGDATLEKIIRRLACESLDILECDGQKKWTKGGEQDGEKRG